ncbi:apyrase [Leptinotarsa decemlineata]|uniref:apyrase n=1 Tax=Leptinotarsa decemlineata TaxID=7539 RepID=UPI003D307B3B
MIYWLLFIVFAVTSINCANLHVEIEKIFQLSVIHFNDFHARFDQINHSGGVCKAGENCIGGFSRLYRQIEDILTDKPSSILLNAGDSFQGTLWYTVGKWNVTQQFMNRLPIDAEVLGNHDFDDGISGVVPYIKSLHHPVVVCNIDDELEPEIQRIYQKSIVIEREGKKIGVIGVILSECDKIAKTGQLKFLLESPSVNAEAERLVKEEGVYTNIVLSHSGYDIDKKIAANASEKISLIVGGHSHTFLFTGDDPPGPDIVGGPYPTVVKSKYGHTVLVTQASALCKYLGNITIFFYENGEVIDYSGQPIFLSSNHQQDEQINQELSLWKNTVESQGDVVLGSTFVTLSGESCYNRECSLGNFVADAMVYAYTSDIGGGPWTRSSIAVVNPGGMRNDIRIGDITYNDLATAQPFENTFDIGEIEGVHLRELFEYTSLPYRYKNAENRLNILQVSGLKIIYKLKKPEGQRLESLKVLCQNCSVPVYEDLDDNKTYSIVVISHLLDGGRYPILTNKVKNRTTGRLDMDVLIEFLAHRDPVFIETGTRLTFN